MLKLENVDIVGFEPALRGMRNPKNSWDKSDSSYVDGIFTMGKNDTRLAETLAKAGPTHAKFRRMITVYVDITAPMYWWKEFDTYKVGTVADSCSTMHKLDSRDLTEDDFSTEHLTEASKLILWPTINEMNHCRRQYKDTKNKYWWWQMVQLLPMSYNQKRTIMLNYEVLANIYSTRRNHKLDEWHTFCDWIECLPYSHSLITGDVT